MPSAQQTVLSQAVCHERMRRKLFSCTVLNSLLFVSTTVAPYLGSKSFFSSEMLSPPHWPPGLQACSMRWSQRDFFFFFNYLTVKFAFFF